MSDKIAENQKTEPQEESIYPKNPFSPPQPRSPLGQKLRDIIEDRPRTSLPGTQTRNEGIHTKPLINEGLRGQWYEHLDEIARIALSQMTRSKGGTKK